MTLPTPMGVGKGDDDDRTPNHKARRSCKVWQKIGKNKISELADKLEQEKKNGKHANTPPALL